MIDNPEISQKEIARVSALMAEGFAFHQAGKIASAKQRYREVLEINPQEPDALHFMGILAHQDGKNEKAISYLKQAVQARENFMAALQNLSKILLIEEYYSQALEVAQQVLALDENAHQALRASAHAYQELHQFDKAYEAYRKIDELFPNEVGTVRNVALALSGLRRRDEAVAMYRRALALEPQNIITRLGLATALNAAGAYDEAIQELDIIIERKPNYVPALVHKGSALAGLDRFDEAEALFREALKIDPNHPEAHFNLGLELLSNGDLNAGWSEYAWRWKTETFVKQPLPTRAPIWQGQDLKGKSILLYPEQGMGDSIQFVRYVRLLSGLGARVHCCCLYPLFNLLRTIEGAAGVHELGKDIPSVDYQISMMELPRLLKTDLHNIPLADGYLKAPKVDFTRPSNLSVGVVWQGNPSHERDNLRSTSLEALAAIFDLDGITYFSLQKGGAEAKIEELNLQDRILNMSDQLSDFAMTAGIIAKLDLVISVDTSVAHVAGAIGQPIWLMLPTAADWRWGRVGETTPWYDTMRLYRQTSRGDWSDVVERLCADLQKMANEYKH